MSYDEALVERVAKALFASENCGRSDDVDDRWATCLNDSNHAEYYRLSRAALDAMPPQPVCDGGCSYNDGPDETCSAHGRPVAEVWEIVAQIARERDALRDAARPTESEVATAVYRHFTTPSREQIARVIHDMTCRSLVAFGECEHQSHVDDWSDVLAHAIHALFEQNGAEHE